MTRLRFGCHGPASRKDIIRNFTPPVQAKAKRYQLTSHRRTIAAARCLHRLVSIIGSLLIGVLGSSATVIWFSEEAGASERLSVSVEMPDSLYTETPRFRVAGVRPGAAIRIRLRHVDEGGATWESWGQFSADMRGQVDPWTAPSMQGTYLGVDPHGLWWSMRPAGVEDHRVFQVSATNPSHMMGSPAGSRLAPWEYTLHVETAEQIVASRRIIRRRLAKSVCVEDLSSGRVRGIWFKGRCGAPSKGAILIVTGSGGSIERSYAPLLASEGFDVLAVASFNWPGRPTGLHRLDLEYFRDALDRLREGSGWQRVAVQGGSRGGELALILGSYFPERVAGVVGISANSHVFAGSGNNLDWDVPAYTRNGIALKFGRLGTFDELKALSTDHLGRINWAEAYERPVVARGSDRFAIAVERIEGPILLICGASDAIWNCRSGGDRILNRLRLHGRQHHLEHLVFREVGHVIQPPHSVTSLASSFYHPLFGTLAEAGGKPDATGSAAPVAWAALLRFYGRLFDGAKLEGGNK